MHRVILSLASNRYQKSNLFKARRCLEEVLTDVHFSSEHWTQPVGSNCRRETYLNQLADATTELDEAELTQWLKQKELDFGRTESRRRRGVVPIDLDILQFDDERRHLKDWDRSYVADLIGELQQ